MYPRQAHTCTEHTNKAIIVCLPLAAFRHHHQISHKTQVEKYRDLSPALPLWPFRTGINLWNYTHHHCLDLEAQSYSWIPQRSVHLIPMTRPQVSCTMFPNKAGVCTHPLTHTYTLLSHNHPNNHTYLKNCHRLSQPD